ncbi:MAG: TraB/GumN family protein [Rubricella sp.]
MLRAALFSIIIAAGATAAQAQCVGEDLRTMIPESEIAAMEATIGALPFGRGIAFEAVRGEDRVTLFGTIHVSDARASLSDAMEARLLEADLLMVEATMQDQADVQARFATDPGLVMRFDGTSLRDELSPKEWNQLVQSVQPLGMPQEAAAMLRPGFAALMLAIPACEAMAQATGGLSLDVRIEQRALEAGIPVAALEPAAETLDIFLGAPAEDQIAQLRFAIATAPYAAASLVTSVTLWREENPRMIWEIGTYLTEREMGAEAEETLATTEAALLDTRNRAWIEEIEARLAQHDDLFVAAGALHLPGEAGLPALLQARGFEITRLDAF